MPSYILTNTSRDLWTESFVLDSADLSPSGPAPWSVTKRTLRGGRREGVDVIRVRNGPFAFTVVPTRGMGIWRARLGADPIGWRSPVADGPVNPAFVNLLGWGGKGWLDGFNELMVRCGLEHNGAPYEEKVVHADGSESHTVYPLHGRVANIPAHFVAVHVDEGPSREVAIEGHVDEARLFGPHLRLITRIATMPGASRLTVRDEVRNLGDGPGELQLLYHWNFGPPHLEEGSRLVAPARTVVPRDARAVEGIGHFDVFAGPEPGFAEQVYYYELLGEGREGRTVTMLRNRAGDKAVALRFASAQLPRFVLWKNTGGLRDGYVTGLEPATNYPNPKPFEKARDRVVRLDPCASYVAETTFEALDGKPAVEKVEAEIRALQASAAPTIHERPVEPFAPAP
jgi:hypothetical protein